MDKEKLEEQRQLIGLFVENQNMFDAISAYISDIPEVSDGGLSNEDFGAMVRAHRQFKTQLRDKFTELKIIAGQDNKKKK